MTIEEWKKNNGAGNSAGTKTTSVGGGYSGIDDWKSRNLRGSEESLKSLEGIDTRINNWFTNSSNLAASHNDRYSESGKYLGDYNEWRNNVARQRAALITEAREINSILQANRDYLDQDWLTSVTDAMRENRLMAADIYDFAEKDIDRWSQFASEEDYCNQ